MNRTEAAALCNLLGSLWATFPANKSTADAWADVLFDVPFKEAAMAVRHIARNSTNQFPPTVGEIMEVVRRARNPEETTAEQEFDLVMKMAGSLGFRSWNTVEESLSPTTLAAVRSVSWRRFCYDPTERHGQLRSHFLSVYKAIQGDEKFRNEQQALSAAPKLKAIER